MNNPCFWQIAKIAVETCGAETYFNWAIFISKNGKLIDRSSIWRKMKQLCRAANVKGSKVFPHNLRKLFAQTFYDIEINVAKLADILGHSSVNIMRVYILTTGVEHRRKNEQLDFGI